MTPSVNEAYSCPGGPSTFRLSGNHEFLNVGEAVLVGEVLHCIHSPHYCFCHRQAQ